MSFVEKLQPASFRGVSFLVSTESVDRGKKFILHEYPNTDVRYVEELGKLPPIFNLTAIVHGDDSINQRLRLENALEIPGLGDLVHPIYGRLSVKSLEHSVSSNQTEVGQFVFNIRFAQSRENITPSPEAPTNSTISSQAATVRGKLDDELESNYIVPTTAENYERVVNTLQNTFNSVHDEISRVVNLSETGAAKFSRIYRTVTNNITSIVSSAFQVKYNIKLFYDSALDAAVFVEQLGDAWDRLISTELTVSTAPKTQKQSDGDQNDYTITEHLKLTSLANSYESKVYTDYTTDEILSTARSKLNQNYKNGLRKKNEEIEAVGLKSIANGQDVRSEFSTLRNLSRKVFDEKEKAVYRVVDITPGRSSMSLTAYRYYGGLDFIGQLVTLNPTVNHAGFYTTIKALTE